MAADIPRGPLSADACSFCLVASPPKLIRGRGDASICGDCVLLCLGALTTINAPPLCTETDERGEPTRWRVR